MISPGVSRLASPSGPASARRRASFSKRRWSTPVSPPAIAGRGPGGHADDVAGLPHLQQRDDRAGADQRGDDVGQLDREVVRARELPHGEGEAADQRGGPRGLDAAAPVDHGDEDERHDQRQEGRLAADHRAEVVLGQIGERCQRRDRHRDRAEGHGRGVRHERDGGGLGGLEAQADEHDRADRHRGTEPGQGFEQGAEAEGDQDRLHALVIAEAPERALDDREVPAALQQRVDPDRVDDDPHDREEAEGRALGAGVERLAHRHGVDDHRHEDRHEQRPQGGDMSLQLESTEQHEQRDERQDREDRRQAERIADRIEHLLVHAQSPPEEWIALSYPGQPKMRPAGC